jgi:hypothetical protein
VVHILEAEEVPADLLMKPHADFEGAKEKSPGEAEAVTIRQIAKIVGVSEEEAASGQSTIGAGTTVAWQRLLRRIAGA